MASHPSGAPSEVLCTDNAKLSREIENDLIDRYGIVLSSEALEKALCYQSQAALRKAIELGRVPVPVFKMPYRRGRFALAKDVARWLTHRSREAPKNEAAELEPLEDPPPDAPAMEERTM